MIRRNLTYANVMVTILALLVVGGSGAYAAKKLKLKNNSVTSSKIRDGAVTEPKIANAAVTEPKIANGAVIEPKIANAAVTGPKIANGAVSTAKLGAGANVAWARVGTAGPAVAASPGTTSRLRTSGGTGYCIDTPFNPEVAVVTPDFNNVGFPRAFVQVGGDDIHCAGSEATVSIYNAADALDTANFHVVLHG